MARSLIGGLVARGQPPASIHVAEPHGALARGAGARLRRAVHADNLKPAAAGSVWVFAVKPQVHAPGLRGTGGEVAQREPTPADLDRRRRHQPRSSNAGWAAHLPVVRTMPNTPALLGAGVTGLFANARWSRCSSAHLAERVAAGHRPDRMDRRRSADGRGDRVVRQRPGLRVPAGGSDAGGRRGAGTVGRRGAHAGAADDLRRRADAGRIAGSRPRCCASG